MFVGGTETYPPGGYGADEREILKWI